MEGRTTLIIAHRLSTISLADRVVLLDQHKIVADGTHAELLETTPLYAEILAQAGEFERDADADEGEQEAGSDTDRSPAEPDGQPLRDLLDSVRGGGRS
jgi:ABC-type multidrug transport system ATPase subunit